MSETYTASTFSIHLWAFGVLARFFMYVIFVNLLKVLFVSIYEIDPWIIGLVLAWPRIIDAFLDPFIGNFSDNLRSRWGRRRPILLASSLVGAVSLVLLWWPSVTWDRSIILIWLNVFSFALYVSMGTYEMTHNALGYELSDEYNQRTRVQSIRGVYEHACSSVWNWVYLIVALPIFGGELNAMRVVSVIMAAIVLVSAITMILGTKERDGEISNQRNDKVPLLLAMRQTLTVKPFVIVMLFRIAQTLSTSLYSTLGTWIVIYSVCGGDNAVFGTIQGLSGIIFFVAAFLMVPVSLWLSRKIGKRKGMVYSMALQLLAAVLLPFFAIPGEPYVYLGYMIVAGLCTNIFNLFRDAIMPDVCDLDELQTGKRREGLFTAVLSFVGKLEISICTLLSGVIISWCGFDPQLGAKQPQEVLDNLRLYGFSIKILFVAVCFFIVLYFPLTQKMMEEVREKLNIQRARQKEENDKARNLDNPPA